MAVAGADFIFNRFNQLTPTSNLQYYAPGQAAPAAQQVGFNRDFLTSTAGDLFARPSGPQPGTGAPNGNPAYAQGFPPNMQAQALPGETTPQTQNRPGVADGIPNPPRGRSGKGGQSGGGYTPQAGDINIPGLTNPITANFGGLSNATAVQTLAPDLLALENARLSQNANTLGEGLRRQNEVANGALPSLISSLNTQGLGSGQTGVTGVPNLPTNPEQFRQDTINSMFQLGNEPLDRAFNRNIETVEQRLANQGLALGGEAASRVLSDFGREQAQAQQNLALQSVLAGGQEASRGINDITGLRSQGFAEQGQTFGQTEAQRQARLTEQVQNAGLAQGSRIAGLNELNVLLGLPQVNAPGIQSFFQSSPTGVTDAFGLNLSGQTANANRNAQIKGSQLSALGDIGSAAAGIF